MHVKFSNVVFVLFKIHGVFLEGFQIIVPVVDEFFITLDVGGVNPFTDLDFTFAGGRTLVYLKKIPEGVILIEASKREDPAEAWAYGMNAASPVSEEDAGMRVLGHSDIRKDNAVYNI